jgi:crotonobetainyl-CoA:carnitine CoA-transferase CaiB-like acyl-CoA transferase
MDAGTADGALAGVRVVELAGPLGEWCGRLLAGLGADVIKVEPPGGGATRAIGPFFGEPHPDRSLHFWHTNAGKRGIVLDTATPEGRDRLRRLLATADVFVETLALDEAATLGVEYDALAGQNPRLVHCSISPFGPDGPYAELQTTDLISMALGGPIQSCGYDREENLPPVRPGADHSYHTVGHFAITGILAALMEREESGLGQHLDVAAHDCLSVTLEFANTFWYGTHGIVRRQTGRHAYPTPTPSTQYRCADGRYALVGLPRDDHGWQRLKAMLTEAGLGEGLDDPSLDDPVSRAAQGGRIYNLIEVFCALHTADEIFHLGQEAGLTWGAVRAPEEWLADPHAAARGFLEDVEHPELGRSFIYPGAPFPAPASPFRVRRRAPLMGEHTAEVLAELG